MAKIKLFVTELESDERRQLLATVRRYVRANRTRGLDDRMRVRLAFLLIRGQLEMHCNLSEAVGSLEDEIKAHAVLR